MPFINFEEAEQLATIEELADMDLARGKSFRSHDIGSGEPQR